MRNTLTTATLLAIAASTAIVGAQEIQPDPAPYRTIALEGDASGVIAFDARDQEQVLYSTIVGAEGATWLRAGFGETQLGRATLRITSLRDGHQQRLDRVTIAQWQHQSAVFNGDAVFVELVAPAGVAGRASVEIVSLMAGEPDAPGETICDVVDDRQLSTDPRVGRYWPARCTVWLIDDCGRCLITAGHCAPNSGSVVEFNAPISTPSGTPVAAAPEDQYPIDFTSVQSVNGGVGNDYCYFGVFPNSNTGLHPADAQGATFSLASSLPTPGETIRITGHGITSSPVDPTYYRAQKTHSGPERGSSGTTVRYRTDTTSGNSGSPVIQEATGLALGVHTHAGCTNGGGANQGTAIVHSGFQAALANPRGVCACPDCPADLTGEGDINTNDFFQFLAYYDAQDSRADFEPGGGINTNDFFAYLAAYQAGC